jgi:hypothetical protein
MGSRPARVKVYSSAIPVSVWSGLALVAIAAAIVWALPQARLLVVAGLVSGAVLAAALVMLRRRSAARPDTTTTPLHLRD